VYGQGVLAEAVAALIGIRGHQVALVGTREGVARRCEITTDANVHYTTACAVQALPDLGGLRGAEAVVVAVPATAYGATFEELFPYLSSGQTVFIVGAVLGAALEVETFLSSRSDLMISVVEVSRPFTSADVAPTGLRINGARETLMLAGRTLNQTRTGLSVGGGIMNGLVPASNILERAFFDMDGWLDTAALLFNILGTQPTGAVISVMAVLRQELQHLAKAYGINRLPEPHVSRHVRASDDIAALLEDGIVDEFVILSTLARLKYVSTPVLDSVIDLASAVLGSDVRKEGRQLDDLGLIGMDAQEIIEHISA
jgi:opine dehydrogenase